MAHAAPPERLVASPEPEDTKASKDDYTPLIGFDLGKWRLEAPISLRTRYQGASSMVLDRRRTELAPSALNSQIRVGLKIDARDGILPLLFSAEYEHDLLTGVNVNRTELEGVGLPESEEMEQQLRKAFARVSIMQYAHLIGGVMTSHWGLGLIANDGAHGWAPGNASFNDPRGGDRVIRGMLATGPHGRRAQLMGLVAVDRVLGDDVMLEGDEATQVVAAVIWGRDKPDTAGAYFVRRHQENEAGRGLDVNVLDLTGKTTIPLGETRKLVLEAEAALIFGSTTLAALPELPEADVLQIGAAARASYDAGDYGMILDFLFATGDQNIDDAKQTGFRTDQNYNMGLLLYRQLLTAQTGRAPVIAGDPDLVGVPPPDVERFSTRGQITGTLAFFPRGWWRPIEGLEVYGGPLVAFATADVFDPFNSRINGGVGRNALEGPSGGRYLGTELDLGVRYRTLVSGVEVVGGLEGGLLLPGSAFDDATGAGLDTLFGGRALLSVRL
jgi:hypothetical protein